MAQGCNPNDCSPQFGCLSTAGAHKQGDDCQLVIGRATCGDGLTCVVLQPPTGQCRPYCDPSSGSRHGCDPGNECKTVTVGSAPDATENVCLPVNDFGDSSLSVQDAGDGGGAAPSEAGCGSGFPCGACVDACAGGACVQGGGSGDCCTCQ